jgi:hypothetical protein
MTKKVTHTLLLLLGGLVLAYQGTTLLAAPPQQAATPTPAASEEPLEEPVVKAGTTVTETADMTETVAAEPTLAELAARVDALQTQIDALAAANAGSGQANEVATAVYLLDSAGLHALDVRLNEEGVIEASDAGNVARVARLLGSVDWPAELAADAAALTDVLTQLASALNADDVETAAPLATQTHETQHDFSHAVEHWLGEVSGGHGEESAGAHGEEELTE